MCKFFINFSNFKKSLWWVHFCWMFLLNRNFGDAICSTGLERNYINILYISVHNFVWCPPNQNPGAATVHYILCMKKKACSLYIFRFSTMHYSISNDFSITLFGFLSSLAFYNWIENLTLITKFCGAPILMGGGAWGRASFVSKSRRPCLYYNTLYLIGFNL